MNEYTKKKIENNLHKNEGKILDLTHETMSISDYRWLAEIIKTSSVLEKIILPHFSNGNVETILLILNEATIRNSTLIKIDFNIPTLNTLPENINRIWQQIQFRLQRNQKKIFGIHGGGNIGLGLMADIIAKSPYRYQVLASSNNQFNCNLINSNNQLWLQHSSNDVDQTRVSNVTMLSRESIDIVRLYSESCIVAICLTSTVMSNVAEDIARALITRYQIDGSGLTILVLMNIPHCGQFVHDKVFNEMASILGDRIFADKIMSCSLFVPTVIDRIVTPIPSEKIEAQLTQQLAAIDKAKLNAIVHETRINAILSKPAKLAKVISAFHLHFNLFNAEKKFTMYVSDDFLEAKHFPLMKITKNLHVIEEVKNKYINGPHAILAWMGALLGYSTIAESIRNPVLFKFIKELMEKEIAPILHKEYPEIAKEDLRLLEDSFFERCAASTDDPVVRVGRDPLRKLDRGGRIRGTIELAQKHQLSISTSKLERGIAAGFLYAVEGVDPENPCCQKIMEVFKENNRSFSALLSYSGKAPSGTFSGLNPKKDGILINNILSKMYNFKQWHETKRIANQSSTAVVLSRMNDDPPAKSNIFVSPRLQQPFKKTIHSFKFNDSIWYQTSNGKDNYQEKEFSCRPNYSYQHK